MLHKLNIWDIVLVEGLMNLNWVSSIHRLSPVFLPQCLSKIPPTAFKLVNSTQLGNLSIDTCPAISNAIINNLNQDSFAGFSIDCINYWNISIINNMAISQIPWFSTTQCSQFSGALVSQLNINIYSVFNKTQLEQFTPEAVGMLTIPQLSNSYSTYQLNYFYFYNDTYPTTVYFNNTPSDTIMGFKNLFKSETLVPYLTSDFDKLQNLTTVNWLLITAIQDSEIQKVLVPGNNTGMSITIPRALAGLRSAQVKLLNDSTFSWISSEQAYFLYPDVLGAMKASQYMALTSSAISGINPKYINDIPADIYPSLNCVQWMGWNKDQKANFTQGSLQQIAWNKQNVVCTYGLFQTDSLLTGFGISAAISIFITVSALLIMRKRTTSYDPIKH